MKYSILLASLLLSGSLLANDYQPLFDSCQSLKKDAQSSQAQACGFFIKGFMAAASLTGVPLDSSLNKGNSDFFNRAYDSRLGLTSADTRQKACDVPQNQELIITDVASNLPAKLNKLTDLKLVIINALKSNQSCGSQKQ